MRCVPCFLQGCISFLILWKEKGKPNTLLRCLHKQVQVWEHWFHGFSLQPSFKIMPSQLLLCTSGKLAQPLLRACGAPKGQRWSKDSCFYPEEENRQRNKWVVGSWMHACRSERVHERVPASPHPALVWLARWSFTQDTGNRTGWQRRVITVTVSMVRFSTLLYAVVAKVD